MLEGCKGSRGFGNHFQSGAVCLLAGAVLLFCCISALAQSHSGQALKIVTPFPAGISVDVLARALAQKLTEHLGQPVVVEARPGANGAIASGAVAKSPPDGNTMLFTTGSHVANVHVMKNIAYHPIRDFAPVTQVTGAYGLALITDLPVNSVSELVALAKQKPGELSYATSGIGNPTHVAGRLLEERAGIKMIAVPYNTPTLMTDVLTNTVNMAFVLLINATPLANSGQVKVLAITSAVRAPALPNVPTMEEAGIKNYSLPGYHGIFFPAGTPRDRIDRIYRETAKAMATPELQKLVEDSGLYVVASSPDEFARFLAEDDIFQSQLMNELDLRPK